MRLCYVASEEGSANKITAALVDLKSPGVALTTIMSTYKLKICYFCVL